MSLRASLVRFVDSGGATLGTGFAIHGAVLSCCHVAANASAIIVESGSRVPIGSDEVRLDPERDIAVIRADIDIPPLPVGPVDGESQAYVTAGFPFSTKGVMTAIDAGGAIRGRTTIQYEMQSPDRIVQLSDVLQLAAGPVAPGLSGAPVIDPESGAVVAMVVADFDHPKARGEITGFAQPVSAFLESPVAKSAVASALERPAREGPCPNAAGAIAICSRATAHLLAMLTRLNIFRPDHTIRRHAFEHELEAFLNGRETWTALIDDSGVGKTTLMADVAKRMSDRPRLLLRGVDIGDVAADSLSALVASVLGKVSALGLPSLEALARASGGRKAPLILVDGLNEARASHDAIRNIWVPDAIELCERAGAKLLISCRPDVWALISPDPGFPRSRLEERARPQPLGDFSAEEALDFLKRRGISLSSQLQDVRNPLMLQLAADAHTGRTGSPPTLPALLDAYLHRQASAIAARLGRVTASSRTIGLASRLAAEALASGTDRVALGDRSPDDAAVFEQLVQENVLIPANQEFRFRYDLLLEHLQGGHLRLETLRPQSRMLWVQDGIDRPFGWGPVVAFSKRLAATGPPEAIDLLLERLGEAASAAGDRVERFVSVDPMIRALAPLPLVERHLEKLGTILEELASTNAYLTHARLPIVMQSPWSPGVQLQALELCVLADRGHSYRATDLTRPFSRHLTVREFERSSIAEWLRYLLLVAREDTVSALRRWISDERPLGQFDDSGRIRSESSLSSWAAWAVFVLRQELGLDDVFSILSESDAPVWALSPVLAETNYDEIVSYLARRLDERASLPKPSLVVHVIRDLVSSFMSSPAAAAAEERSTELVGVLRRALDRFPDVDVQNTIIGCLAALPNGREDAWARLSAMGERGQASVYTAALFIGDKLEAIVNLASRGDRTFYDSHANWRLTLAKALANQRSSDDSEAHRQRLKLAVDLIRTYLESHSVTREAAGAVESLLYAFDLEMAGDLGLLDIVSLIAKTTDDEANALAVFAGSWMDEVKRRPLEDEVAMRLIANAPADVVASMFSRRIELFVNAEPRQDDLAAFRRLIQAAQERFGADLAAVLYDYQLEDLLATPWGAATLRIIFPN